MRTARICALLRARGPMRSTEIADALGDDRQCVSRTLNRMVTDSALSIRHKPWPPTYFVEGAEMSIAAQIRVILERVGRPMTTVQIIRELTGPAPVALVERVLLQEVGARRLVTLPRPRPFAVQYALPETMRPAPGLPTRA